jgi:hypothetical protein
MTGLPRYIAQVIPCHRSIEVTCRMYRHLMPSACRLDPQARRPATWR